MAATMTTAEPSRSPITSRYAPRTLMLVRCAELSSHMATALATSPTMATTSMSPPAISPGPGSSSRRTASMAIHTDSTSRITPFSSAPNTSAR